MINILACCPNYTDTTSWYRAAGPFADLRRQIRGLQVIYSDKFFWVNVKNSDIVFIQRPMSRMHLDIARLAKQCSIPLWVEYDDDLFNVPVDNPYHSLFQDKDVREVMTECMKMADVLTVASTKLKDTVKHLNENIVVIPNAFDEAWLKDYSPFEKQKNPNTVFWRGSDTHVKDLMTVADEIKEVAQAFPHVIWRFAGYLPWFLAEAPEMKGKIEYIKTLDPVQYFNYLKAQDASIGIVPLVRSDFNECKSNIAWQEMTLSGCTVIAPDMPQWHMPGIFTYKDPESFKFALISTLNKEVNREELLRDSYTHIMENLTLSKVNKLRIEVVQRLLDKGSLP